MSIGPPGETVMSSIEARETKLRSSSRLAIGAWSRLPPFDTSAGVETARQARSEFLAALTGQAATRLAACFQSVSRVAIGQTGKAIAIAFVLGCSLAAASAEEASRSTTLAALPVADAVSARPAIRLARQSRAIITDIRFLLEDPAIRNFVGLAENNWDFNADAPSGFGPDASAR
jgi:hypothetical protein